jgi:signal transduction histidine kinase
MKNKSYLKLIVRKELFVVAFIITSIIVYFLLSHSYKINVQNHLETKSEQIYLEYKVIYDSFQTLADIIYKTTINKQEIISLFKNRQRKELQKSLENTYEKLRKYNLRQLHFHLPNNDSFLRMHRPNKFGDNLTKVRPTVRYVNENKTYIHGFEEGKIFNGFRFVFPLSDTDGTHLGSVEISFSSLFFIKDIMKNYSVISNLLMDKKIVDEKVFADEKKNYIQSPLKDYYFQKTILEYVSKDYTRIHLTKEFMNKVKKGIDKGSYFSVYAKKDNEIVTFIPLINPVTKKVVGSLSVRSSDRYIQNQFYYKYILLFFILFSLGAILVFIYKQFSYQMDLEKEVKEKTKELHNFNDTLKDKIKIEIEKNLQKDKLVQEQSKLASMGEMIGSIAHQWRQPLNALNINIQNLDDDFEDGVIDRDFIDKFIVKNREIISFMSQTIDDFRNFFRIDKEKRTFSILESIKSVINIQSAMLKNHNIQLEILGEDFEVFGFHSEFQQVILNIINNAKDQIAQKLQKDGKITISMKNNKIYIQDNGGGIPSDKLTRVFEPYFTTKEEGKGTGMGLYISKLIIEKNMNGKLNVENNEDGALFVIEFEKG